MFIRFDRVHKHDGQTDSRTDGQMDRHRTTAIGSVSRSKNTLHAAQSKRVVKSHLLMLEKVEKWS